MIGQNVQPYNSGKAAREALAHEFWERVYIADIAAKPDSCLHEIAADIALTDWRQRFDPKAGE